MVDLIQNLIERYRLIPHPEGGYYKEVYRSPQGVNSHTVHSERCAVTHIYFLLTKGQISRFHKVCHDEIWNFYEGAPLNLITWDQGAITEQLIGKNEDGYFAIIQGGIYQAAETTGDYTLIGCSVAPGFDFNDFSFLQDDIEQRSLMVTSAPQFKRFI